MQLDTEREALLQSITCLMMLQLASKSRAPISVLDELATSRSSMGSMLSLSVSWIDYSTFGFLNLGECIGSI